MLETYSVLTGFPPPHRASPGLVGTWLQDRFPIVLSPPGAAAQRDLVATMAREGRAGGAIYDALVALTAKLEGAVLVTADRRATAIYELVGVETRQIGSGPIT